MAKEAVVMQMLLMRVSLEVIVTPVLMIIVLEVAIEVMYLFIMPDYPQYSTHFSSSLFYAIEACMT